MYDVEDGCQVDVDEDYYCDYFDQGELEFVFVEVVCGNYVEVEYDVQEDCVLVDVWYFGELEIYYQLCCYQFCGDGYCLVVLVVLVEGEIEVIFDELVVIGVE